MDMTVEVVCTAGSTRHDMDHEDKESSDGTLLNKASGRRDDHYDVTRNKAYDEEQCFPDNSCFRNILYFSAMFGLVGLSTQSLYVCMSSQITTIERRFGLSSTKSSWILSCNDIGFLITVLFVSYFGSRSHIPRLLGALAILCGLAGVLVAFPYFAVQTDKIVLKQNTTVHATSEFLCHTKNNTEGNTDTDVVKTSSSDSLVNLNWVLPFLCVCVAVQGMSKSARVSLSSLYIDCNSDKKTKTGFYIGIVSTLTVMGPFVAMIISGLFGRLPENLGESDLEPNDPRWISAWWLVFVVFGGFTVLTGIPILFFPKTMMMNVETKCSKKKRTRLSTLVALKDLPIALLRIVKKPVYLLLLFGFGFGVFGGIAILSFGPKFYEVQFNIPTWQANVTIGIQMFISMSLGTFAGGTVMTWMKLSRLGTLKLIAIMWSFTVVVPILYNFLGCDNKNVIGIDAEQEPDNGCGCSTTDYLPVCSGGNVTYRTPCLAGCTNYTNQVYAGCSESPTGRAINGLCERSCVYFYPFVIASFLNHLCGTMCLVPCYVSIIRSVSEKDRGLAMGFTLFCMGVVALLIPQVYGRVIDSTCRFWTESFGVTGSCALYDVVDLRFKLALFTVAFNFGGLLLYVIAILVIQCQSRKGAKPI